ncbi:MAG: secretin and TonB N-terminal domain-containing protein [Muribaculaceae bacterium]|nr:secretin and TonB N-terminal domain-containing protein [Muribaculaceae bacterium]
MRRIGISVLFLAAVMGAAAKNITIKAANEPAEQVFQSIIAQTGMNFVYTAGMLDGMKVSLDVRDMPLRDVLRSVFEGSAVTYRIKGRNVILSRRQSARALTSISGYVRESGTGEALIGAIVADSLSGVATTTNAAGFYSLRVPVSGARLTACL